MQSNAHILCGSAVPLGLRFISLLQGKESHLLSVVRLNGDATFFKADRAVAMVLWGTVAASITGASLLGVKGFNTSHFDAPMHFLFGFLARELIKNANDYYPFVDKFRDRFPKRIARFITPGTFAIALCLGNGIQEELQKAIPLLSSIVYTDLPEQVIDIAMDLAGVTFSANRSSLRALLRRRPREERIGLSANQVHGEE